MNIKEKCAKEAFKLIPNHSIIGLGGGSTISYLIKLIRQSELNISIVTPSIQTKFLCHDAGLNVLDPMFVHHIDLAFDGCDEVDSEFNVLKSGGGIHTLEKLIASMADDYIVLIDESKYSTSLTFKHPIVLEVLAEAVEYVKYEVMKLGGIPNLRTSTGKDGFTITENGHYLIDTTFDEVAHANKLNEQLNALCGVIGTSLFTKEVTKILMVTENETKLMTK